MPTCRKRKPKSDEAKLLKDVRNKLPTHVLEIELAVTERQDWMLKRIGEQLRIIRNTVMGQLLKNYNRMISTKAYRQTIKQYRQVCNSIKNLKSDNNRELLNRKKDLAAKLDELHSSHNVTFEYTRKYGEGLNRLFSLPDSVTTLTVCEMVWQSIEALLFRNAERPYFYRKGGLVTFQGKQANKSIILKHDSLKNSFYISYMKMAFPLIVKERDLYVPEALDNIAYYMLHGAEIDRGNMQRYEQGLDLHPTYRPLNNRIVRKQIRGKTRYYVQIALEGAPVPRRKKDGSMRHVYGVGRIGGDVGTQSLATVSKDQATLINLAERSPISFAHEHKIYLLQRYLDRSKRATNPENFNENGTVKKGRKAWKYSKRYRVAKTKIKELHRKAAASRQYAINEEVNYLRSLGNELIIESMDIKALQKKAKEVSTNPKTGKFNRRKRYGKSIGKRCPGYLIQQAKYRFKSSGGIVREVNTWTFKASQYDHILDDTDKKQLSMRWHTLPNGTKIQRDIYSAFLLYCAMNDLQKPDKEQCDEFFGQFLVMHDRCVGEIAASGRTVMNSGIKAIKVA